MQKVIGLTPLRDSDFLYPALVTKQSNNLLMIRFLRCDEEGSGDGDDSNVDGANVYEGDKNGDDCWESLRDLGADFGITMVNLSVTLFSQSGARFFCKNCNMAFLGSTIFAKHKKYQCVQKTTEECWICQEEFSNKDTLLKHLESHVEAMMQPEQEKVSANRKQQNPALAARNTVSTNQQRQCTVAATRARMSSNQQQKNHVLAAWNNATTNQKSKSTVLSPWNTVSANQPIQSTVLATGGGMSANQQKNPVLTPWASTSTNQQIHSAVLATGSGMSANQPQNPALAPWNTVSTNQQIQSTVLATGGGMSANQPQNPALAPWNAVSTNQQIQSTVLATGGGMSANQPQNPALAPWNTVSTNQQIQSTVLATGGGMSANQPQNPALVPWNTVSTNQQIHSTVLATGTGGQNPVLPPWNALSTNQQIHSTVLATGTGGQNPVLPPWNAVSTNQQIHSTMLAAGGGMSANQPHNPVLASWNAMFAYQGIMPGYERRYRLLAPKPIKVSPKARRHNLASAANRKNLWAKQRQQIPVRATRGTIGVLPASKEGPAMTTRSKVCATQQQLSPAMATRSKVSGKQEQVVATRGTVSATQQQLSPAKATRRTKQQQDISAMVKVSAKRQSPVVAPTSKVSQNQKQQSPVVVECKQIVDPEKPHLCRECGKGFRTVRLLAVHRKSHKWDDENNTINSGKLAENLLQLQVKVTPTLACTLCSRQFPHMNALDKHIKNTHWRPSDSHQLQCNGKQHTDIRDFFKPKAAESS